MCVYKQIYTYIYVYIYAYIYICMYSKFEFLIKLPLKGQYTLYRLRHVFNPFHFVQSVLKTTISFSPELLFDGKTLLALGLNCTYNIYS
jgi:hypothetical protein